MKHLTLEHAIKNNFTAIDCVRYFKPEYDDNMCDFILYEHTCFPLCSGESTINQLNKFFTKELCKNYNASNVSNTKN